MLNPPKAEVSHLDPETVVSFLPMETIGFGSPTGPGEPRPLADVYNSFTYFTDGDVLVAKITPSFENGKGAIGEDLISGIGFGTTELHVLRPDRINSRYLNWLLQSRTFRLGGAVMMTGAAGQQRVPEDYFADFRVPVDHVPTQRKIADFLDLETERINALIDKKRRLIDLLEEKRTATITHAVTKGLDPTAPVKDSGVPWIGKIPGSWRVAPIRHVAAFRNSNVDKKVVDGETPVLLCNYTDVYYGTYLASTDGFMPGSATAEEILRFRLKEDTVIITKDSESADDIGVPAYVARQLDAVCGYHLTVLDPVRSLVTGEFLYWVLESTSLRQAFETHAQGVTRFGLTQDGIGSPAIPVPGIPEQRAIVDRLCALDRHVRELAQRIETQLSFLAEYREALITAAVTGEIDVDTFDGEQAIERTAS